MTCSNTGVLIPNYCRAQFHAGSVVLIFTVRYATNLATKMTAFKLLCCSKLLLTQIVIPIAISSDVHTLDEFRIQSCVTFHNRVKNLLWLVIAQHATYNIQLNLSWKFYEIASRKLKFLLPRLKIAFKLWSCKLTASGSHVSGLQASRISTCRNFSWQDGQPASASAVSTMLHHVWVQHRSQDERCTWWLPENHRTFEGHPCRHCTHCRPPRLSRLGATIKLRR